MSRAVDIELTNACNTNCVFCPRDKAPRRGFISEATFEKVVERVLEEEDAPAVHLCGLGEPTLHPQLVPFVRELSQHGLRPMVATNGSRLTRDLSQQLLDAGLMKLTVSATGIHEVYERLHHLEFESTKQNVHDFLAEAARRPPPQQCEVVVGMVDYHGNREQLVEAKRFWRDAGIERFNVFDFINRGGALDSERELHCVEAYREQAASLLDEHGISRDCWLPFVVVFVGWDGNYYMCCHDFTKRSPLGGVFNYGFSQIDEIKRERLSRGFSVCRECSLARENVISRTLDKIARQLVPPSHLEQKLKKMKPAMVKSSRKTVAARSPVHNS